MSKFYVTPIRGGEVSPDVTAMPVVMRFNVVLRDNMPPEVAARATEEAQRLIAASYGNLTAYVQRLRNTQLLSINEFHSQQISEPPFFIRWTRNGPQEYVSIDVVPRLTYAPDEDEGSLMMLVFYGENSVAAIRMSDLVGSAADVATMSKAIDNTLVFAPTGSPLPVAQTKTLSLSFGEFNSPVVVNQLLLNSGENIIISPFYVEEGQLKLDYWYHHVMTTDLDAHVTSRMLSRYSIPLFNGADSKITTTQEYVDFSTGVPVTTGYTLVERYYDDDDDISTAGTSAFQNFAGVQQDWPSQVESLYYLQDHDIAPYALGKDGVPYFGLRSTSPYYTGIRMAMSLGVYDASHRHVLWGQIDWALYYKYGYAGNHRFAFDAVVMYGYGWTQGSNYQAEIYASYDMEFTTHNIEFPVPVLNIVDDLPSLDIARVPYRRIMTGVVGSDPEEYKDQTQTFAGITQRELRWFEYWNPANVEVGRGSSQMLVTVFPYNVGTDLKQMYLFEADHAFDDNLGTGAEPAVYRPWGYLNTPYGRFEFTPEYIPYTYQSGSTWYFDKDADLNVGDPIIRFAHMGYFNRAQYYGWMNLCNGQHLLQAFYMTPSGRKIYINGYDYTVTLPEMLGVSVDDIRAVLFDVPLERMSVLT